MLIIDCDAYFGRRPNSADDTSLETLIELERKQGVGCAAAYCLKARIYDAREGNDEALEAARRHAEVLPVASVDPRTLDRIEDEIERVAGLGFAAVRVFPETQGWSVDSVLFSRIVRACDRHDMPLMVPAEAAGKASAIVSRAMETTNPVILLGANYNTQAEALSAAADRPNTFVSTQFFVTPGVVELAAEALGADKLVLGTGAPECTGRPAINMILQSELSEAEKAAILGGNLAAVLQPRLAKLGRSLPEADAADHDAHATWGPVVDVHGHLGPWPFPMRGWNAGDLVKLMKRRGIEKAILSSTKAIVSDFVEGNAELAREIEPHPELFGYVTINPHYPERSIEELDKYLRLPKFVGAKFHCGYAGVPIDGEALRKLLPAAAEKNVPILIHCWGHGEPTRVLRIAREFPQIRFIMGHGGVVAWQEAVETMKAAPNVYTEFSSSRSERGRVRATIDQVGCSRILFGSDLGLFDPAYDMGVYEDADLTPAERRAIMYDNATELFRLC